MSYDCLKEKQFEDGSYEILPIRKEDMTLIKDWRNAQITILRQEKLLTDKDQEFYWEHVIEPSFLSLHPKQILFSFLKDKILIGYGGITYIDWTAKRAEVSFLLETSRADNPQIYQNEFFVFLTLLTKAIFGSLHFHRLFAETFDLRPLHIATLERFGFIEEGRLRDHVKIEGRYYDSLIHGLVNDRNF